MVGRCYKDKSLSAQFEHSIGITNVVEILQNHPLGLINRKLKLKTYLYEPRYSRAEMTDVGALTPI